MVTKGGGVFCDAYICLCVGNLLFLVQERDDSSPAGEIMG